MMQGIMCAYSNIADFTRNYNDSRVFTDNGVYNRTTYHPIGNIARFKNGEGTIYGETIDDSDTFTPGGRNIIVQYYSVGYSYSTGHTSVLVYPDHNETVLFGSAHLNDSSNIQVTQFHCSVEMKEQLCKLSNSRLSDCHPQLSAMQAGDLAAALDDDWPGSAINFLSQGDLLQAAYWVTNDSLMAGIDEVVHIADLEHGMRRLFVNAAYAYGQVAVASMGRTAPHTYVSLNQPNAWGLVTLSTIAVLLQFCNLCIVWVHIGAYSVLTSGLDVIRTAAQSAYLCDITQGRCAELDINPSVALSFSRNNPGQPGHVHFLGPGHGEKWNPKMQYAGRPNNLVTVVGPGLNMKMNNGKRVNTLVRLGKQLPNNLHVQLSIRIGAPALYTVTGLTAGRAVDLLGALLGVRIKTTTQKLLQSSHEDSIETKLFSLPHSHVMPSVPSSSKLIQYAERKIKADTSSSDSTQSDVGQPIIQGIHVVSGRKLRMWILKRRLKKHPRGNVSEECSSSMLVSDSDTSTRTLVESATQAESSMTVTGVTGHLRSQMATATSLVL